MYIYKITNKVNGKVYIGQSIRSIEQRFQRHINDAVNNILDTHFARAIRKYGKENFYIELVETCDNQTELNLREQYWIRKYDSINNGYNETDATSKCGGNKYMSKTESEMKEISEKISKTKLGSKNPHSRSVKVFNIVTNEEKVFDTVSDCRKFFKEKNHRFITTRVTGLTKSLYKNEWKIAYTEDEYREFSIGVHRERTRWEYLV